ncbi:MAG: sorbosone dehydrogenase family protein [Chloroflexi bacterium]|nr:sorbosone dehydrogenase family protein [Chloroflexota bacterium]
MGAPSATAQDGRLDSLQLPPGFQIGLFAANLDGVRFMTVGPSGDMYASLMSQGEIVRLPDRNGDGVADDTVVVAEGLNNPHGLAFHDGALYVGETNQVSRLWDDDGDGVFDRHEHLADLPANGGHSTRTVGFGPDGMLYVSIGSSCNVCNERDARRATIMQFKPDGSDGRVYARGLRNAVGFVFNPTTGDLYATNNGRDQLGDNVPPETVNIVHDGDDFGWPRCINGATPDPQFGTPGACDGVSRPAVEMQAHSAPLGLAFYEGSQFPQGYQGDLFVAFHGSWNRSIPTGYKVVRLRMQDGRPTGEVQDFVTGWLQGTRAWGRPVDVISAPDGALLISDDKAGQIYRVTYAG